MLDPVQEADLHLTPSRLLLRLREARAAASSAASGARRARAAASAAETHAAAAEAAEQRSGARLLAAEQRVHALDEQARRLQAKLGRTEVDLVCGPLSNAISALSDHPSAGKPDVGQKGRCAGSVILDRSDKLACRDAGAAQEAERERGEGHGSQSGGYPGAQS